MTLDEMTALFSKRDDEFLKSKDARRDLVAFNLLAALVPGDGDIVASAAHDEIWLDTDVNALAGAASEDDIVLLIRCGVRYDDDVESLAMYV